MEVPKGSETLSASVPAALALQIDTLARESSLTRSRYVRLLLEDAVDKGRRFKIRLESFDDPPPPSGKHAKNRN